jgi:peptidoglycan/xylan/chitin deacetylase (PgdA/CDA1 family)
VAIESHTVRHQDLRRLEAAALREELAGSREAIRAHLGREPIVLGYPPAAYNSRVMSAAKAAGYLMAVTTHYGKKLDPVSRHSWPRIRVSFRIDLKHALWDVG